ncbi:Oidioi.mRNA.OKI2018_I69.PAR.g12654.t1.cds [Oikopleura dioica]|uniref:Oidioi.mRNA.OKI2018_I69.PAR.g12654.t1.cds n=1 Tax=Oikopleura dioica TaxID=34765 RepID=A0ABN7S499_OIKDI|nr:Oidioi.mRNA.OKI2018_I69.PAR.g12654.t1.cds [Oikopleura dioica]
MPQMSGISPKKIAAEMRADAAAHHATVTTDLRIYQEHVNKLMATLRNKDKEIATLCGKNDTLKESIKKRKSKLEELCCAEEMMEIKEKQVQKLKEDVKRANLRTQAVKEELKEAHSKQLAIQGEKEILIRRNDALIADNERFRNRLLQTEKDVADTKGELELIDDLINSIHGDATTTTQQVKPAESQSALTLLNKLKENRDRGFSELEETVNLLKSPQRSSTRLE